MDNVEFAEAMPKYLTLYLVKEAAWQGSQRMASPGVPNRAAVVAEV